MKYLFIVLVLAGLSFVSVNNASSREMVELKGTYQSKKGVMHRISCYGYNIGYLTTAGGEQIVICFDQMQKSADLKIECTNISVQGHYSEKTIGGGGNCEPGSMKILYVRKWKCTEAK